MKTNSDIPVFILAGGLGTRLSEETDLKPKPLVEIGGLPILLHIMRRYYAFGFNNFVICAGYRAWDIKHYFLEYSYRLNHLDIDHRTDAEKEPVPFGHKIQQENWRVRVINTGLHTMTGGRVAKAFDELQQHESFDTFALTYGDGLCDVDFDKELEFHRQHGGISTMLGVKPEARFGELEIQSNGKVTSFAEKPESKQATINGGFFFFEKSFRNYLYDDESCILERGPLEKVCEDGELFVFNHPHFWQCMDTLRDKRKLQDLWDKGEAPWLQGTPGTKLSLAS